MRSGQDTKEACFNRKAIISHIGSSQSGGGKVDEADTFCGSMLAPLRYTTPSQKDIPAAFFVTELASQLPISLEVFLKQNRREVPFYHLTRDLSRRNETHLEKISMY